MLTPSDTIKRLANGEDPLDLSIEAWKRKVAWLEEGGDPHHLPIGWMCCPLCVHNRMMHNVPCDECAYYLHYGHVCFRGRPYQKIVRIVVGYDVQSSIGMVLDLAREMVTELEQIQEAHTQALTT